jgi:hypothetical protein
VGSLSRFAFFGAPESVVRVTFVCYYIRMQRQERFYSARARPPKNEDVVREVDVRAEVE